MLNGRPGIALIFWIHLMTGNQLCAQSAIHDRAVTALRKIFSDSVGITSKEIILTHNEIDSIAVRSRSRWQKDTLALIVCWKDHHIAGYGFIDDVKGKVQFITYLAVLTPDGVVKDIDVLAYREAYGGEIAFDSFRRQFRGKIAGDQLRPGREIRNISGATISVHAISDGVRRIVETYPMIKSRVSE